MTARACAHCFAPARPDGRPSCGCEAAAAEDFDPLRIRPYVSLPDAEEPEDAQEPQRTLPDAGGVPPPFPSPFAAPPRSRDRAEHEAAEPLPGAPYGSGGAAGPPPRPSRPRKRTLLAVSAAAVAALAGAAVLLAGGPPADSGDARGLPEDRTRLPGPSRTTATPRAETGHSPAVSPAAPVPPRASRSRAASAAPRTAPAPVPPAPSTAPSTARASGSVTDSPGSRSPSPPPSGPLVLREGAGGPEVVELQLRLRQVGLYAAPADGRYDGDVRDAVAAYQRAYGVQGDAQGVYGLPTRRSLEARTTEP